MANTYEKFLRLVGFEEDEMARYVPEWRKASEKFGLTEEDIRFATEEFIPTNYDIELKGVRKLIGAYIKETIELAKSSEYKQKGVKIVYGILLAITHIFSFEEQWKPLSVGPAVACAIILTIAYDQRFAIGMIMF